MAGHSHSSNIKHRKDAVDKKRSKIFTKIARKLIVAARTGGPDPAANAHLRLCVELARAANMPKDVIKRNIEKGAGIGADAASFEELTYEGYGPGGIAIIADVLTDNRNRTAPELKKIFEKGGGNMGEPGCVGYMFGSKSIYMVKAGDRTEDEIMEIVMEAEAEDMEDAGDGAFLITAEPTSFISVKQKLEEAKLEIELAELSRVPATTIEITDEDHATKVLRLISNLEDNDDVQNVHANFSMTSELLEKASAALG